MKDLTLSNRDFQSETEIKVNFVSRTNCNILVDPGDSDGVVLLILVHPIAFVVPLNPFIQTADLWEKKKEIKRVLNAILCTMQDISPKY